MLKMLRGEAMKTQWWLVLLVALLGPLLAVALGVNPGDNLAGRDAWTTAYGFAAVRYAWLFYPLLAGVMAALICRSDHQGGGWKQLLALPVSRTDVYLAKFVLLAAVLAITNTAPNSRFASASSPVSSTNFAR